MKIDAMVGYKLYKELDNSEISMIRIKQIFKDKETGKVKSVSIYNYNEKSTVKVDIETLKGYTPLEPDGLMTFNVVKVYEDKDKYFRDVIVTASKILNLKIGDTIPWAVCRQNITDVFNNLLVKDPEVDMMVGMAINQEDCPANYDFGLMMACDEIEYTQSINFYRSDTLEDILTMVKKLKFDTVLTSNFNEYVKTFNNPMLLNKNSYKGWCKTLPLLLHQNNFQEDINQMLGITQINPIIKNHIVIKSLPDGEEYESLDDDMKLWLASIYKLAIGDISVLEYNHDINLAEFNNARYFLLRDGDKKLYLVVYTLNGEYHKSDLEAAIEKKDFSEEFRINFYNKYNKNNK